MRPIVQISSRSLLDKVEYFGGFYRLSYSVSIGKDTILLCKAAATW